MSHFTENYFNGILVDSNIHNKKKNKVWELELF
jgi:hypothetical protein